jgi:hypothetical protein
MQELKETHRREAKGAKERREEGFFFRFPGRVMIIITSALFYPHRIILNDGFHPKTFGLLKPKNIPSALLSVLRFFAVEIPLKHQFAGARIFGSQCIIREGPRGEPPAPFVKRD